MRDRAAHKMDSHQVLPLFSPPKEPLSLYRGRVMHMRLKPITHRFNYDVFTILVDLNRLSDVNKATWLFGVNRRAIMSFWEKDHGAKHHEDASQSHGTLLGYVTNLLKNTHLDVENINVKLLCYPRILGYVFNPISVYYIYNKQGALSALIYEVRNTFGEMHTYVAPILEGELSVAGVRQERDKLFYVSPFMDMNLRYHFRMRPPQDDVALRILETDETGPILSASFFGRHKSATTKNVLFALLALPLMPVKVLMGIHYEALRLWIKGVKLRTRPIPPDPVSYNQSHEMQRQDVNVSQ